MTTDGFHLIILSVYETRIWQMANGYIAKYLVTALLLSSTFGDMNNPLIVACVVVASASTLGAGLWLISNTDKKES